jgi:hypothetical protein
LQEQSNWLLGARQVNAMTIPIGHRALIAALTTCLTTVSLAAARADAQPAPTLPAITCTNPASGTTWQISIDYAHATVDSNPASVSAGEISWRDARDGWHYTLDRHSGALTVIVASSTGGYFLHDHCQLAP